MSTPKIWAHRGAPLGRGDLPPENSLSALSRALETGADALEFDLHLTRDGHFVVHHDLQLDHPRLGRVCLPDLNLAEVKEVELDDDGETIPTLEEVVELVPDASIPLIPELKSPDEAERRGLDPVAHFLQVVARLDLSRRLVVQSFHGDTLNKLKESDCPFPLLALYRHDQVVNFNAIPGDAHYLGIPMLSVFFFGKDLVDRAEEEKRKVVPWRDMSLSENGEVFDRMAQFKVEAIMVDDAERALIRYNRKEKPTDYEQFEPTLLCREQPAESRRSRKPA